MFLKFDFREIMLRDIKEFVKEFFDSSFEDYYFKNLDISQQTLESIRVAVIAGFAAIVIASYMNVFNRGMFGDFIKALDSEKAYSPETAKTLGELGFLKNTVIRSAIKGGRKYHGVLRCENEDLYNIERERVRADYNAKASASGEDAKPFKYVPYSFDFEKDRFYIPESEIVAAETRFAKKRGSIWTAVIATVVCLVAVFFAVRAIPEIVQLLDNFVGMINE